VGAAAEQEPNRVAERHTAPFLYAFIHCINAYKKNIILRRLRSIKFYTSIKNIQVYASIKFY